MPDSPWDPAALRRSALAGLALPCSRSLRPTLSATSWLRVPPTRAAPLARRAGSAGGQNHAAVATRPTRLTTQRTPLPTVQRSPYLPQTLTRGDSPASRPRPRCQAATHPFSAIGRAFLALCALIGRPADPSGRAPRRRQRQRRSSQPDRKGRSAPAPLTPTAAATGRSGAGRPNPGQRSRERPACSAASPPARSLPVARRRGGEVSPADWRARPGGGCSGPALTGRGGGRSARLGSAGWARGRRAGEGCGLRAAAAPVHRDAAVAPPAWLSAVRAAGPFSGLAPADLSVGSVRRHPSQLWGTRLHTLPDAQELGVWSPRPWPRL
jgi:hypothetical protein